MKTDRLDSIGQTVGKTITAALNYCGEYLCLHFDDDSFIVIDADCGRDGDCTVGPTMEALESYELYGMRIATEEEAAVIEEEQREQIQQNIEQQDRNQYERLKAKFEKEGGA